MRFLWAEQRAGGPATPPATPKPDPGLGPVVRERAWRCGRLRGVPACTRLSCARSACTRLACAALVALICCSPLAGKKNESGKKSEEPSETRHLYGTVEDRAGHPVPGAVVYLEDERSLALFTYIAGDDGSYHFNNLLPDEEYQVYARSAGHKSKAKTLSSSDAHKRAHIDLQLRR